MAWPSPADINWSNGAGESINYVNQVSLGIFSNMLLFSVYIIILWGFFKKEGDFIGGLAVAGFIVTLAALIMWIGGWVTWVTFGICLGLLVIGAAAVLIDNKN